MNKKIDPYDHYKEATKVVKLLNEDGLTDWANRLMESMEAGSTGTEIFMEMRYVLNELLKSKAKIGPKCSQIIHILISRIEEQLYR